MDPLDPLRRGAASQAPLNGATRNVGLRPQLTPDLAARLRDTAERPLPQMGPSAAPLPAGTLVQPGPQLPMALAPAAERRPDGPGGRRRLDADCRWYVLHTRSRQEKALEETLRAQSIGCYLPLRPRDRRRGGRMVQSHVPLFPGYVFLWGTREELFAADRTRRVANLISVADQAHLEWELSNVSAALSSGASLDPYPAIREGVRVRVASGAFEGIEGVVARRDAADRLVLQVRLLNTAACLDIAGADVELVTA